MSPVESGSIETSGGRSPLALTQFKGFEVPDDRLNLNGGAVAGPSVQGPRGHAACSPSPPHAGAKRSLRRSRCVRGLGAG
jgi:hypothetical protein